MIDLHTHTTASDGRCTPDELVNRAHAAGITVLAVTDHDTVAGCDAADAACATAGITFVPGIEITAIRFGGDVHVLGYFVDRHSPSLLAFLAEQRGRRIERIREMVSKLTGYGIRLDADAILKPGIEDATKAAGRPWIARALVQGGYVTSTNEAFEKWLSRGRPAFVPRLGAAPDEVFHRIHDAGGIASLAHPGLLAHDDWIPEFVSAGLDAIEVYHSEHDTLMTAKYLSIAKRLKLRISGGSDYHADDSHGAAHLGAISLPREDYDQLLWLKHSSRQ
ncbi:MAG TPA: PHP domain-containing protein [Vicinamibacterales bacterium]|nr:PHP domain-containing protein [Vicinamibacterales bacterium]